MGSESFVTTPTLIMVIDNLNIFGMTCRLIPPKANTPFIIDSYTVLTCPCSPLHPFEMVSRWNTQIVKFSSIMDLVQLSVRFLRQHIETLRPFPVMDFFCLFVFV